MTVSRNKIINIIDSIIQSSVIELNTWINIKNNFRQIAKIAEHANGIDIEAWPEK